MNWQSQIKADSLSWLLESAEPGVRYLALRDLADCAADDSALAEARLEAHRRGPIATILGNMEPEGYWVRPGPGYNPKYRSTVWALILLAQLGASAAEDERVARAWDYLRAHALTSRGQFTATGAPSGTIDCLQGNLCAALLDLGCDDERLALAFDWMSRSQTGEGIAPATDRDAPERYYAYKSGPDFACGVNYGDACAWGAVKVMLALSKWPAGRRTQPMREAIARGAEFLLAGNPALAAYPSGPAGKPNRSWWKFGFPVFYVTDILQTVEALVGAGFGADPRLAPALELVREKQDANGRWALDYNYEDKTWVDFGPKKQPNPWVTLRALRALKRAAEPAVPA
jgi:hypothetical protein